MIGNDSFISFAVYKITDSCYSKSEISHFILFLVGLNLNLIQGSII